MSTTENLFEQASRQQLRFDSAVGQLTTEDLWQLPLTSVNKVSLDKVAIALNTQLKNTEESFVSVGTKDKTLQLKFDIVKHIIDVRVAENAAKLDDANKKQRRAQLEELISRKENQGLENLSIEELQALKASL